MSLADQPDAAALAHEYAQLEVETVRELRKRIASGDATSSELATASALIGKAGMPARSAGAGVVGSDERALKGWLDGIPDDEKARLLAEAARVGVGSRGVPKRRGR